MRLRIAENMVYSFISFRLISSIYLTYPHPDLYPDPYPYPSPFNLNLAHARIHHISLSLSLSLSFFLSTITSLFLSHPILSPITLTLLHVLVFSCLRIFMSTSLVEEFTRLSSFLFSKEN